MPQLRGPIIVFGGDGYIGWPLAMHLAMKTSDDVVIFDNMSTRLLVKSVNSDSIIPIATMAERLKAFKEYTGRDNLIFEPGDVRDPQRVDEVIAKYKPSAVVHLAHQRSAPFSMIDQRHAVYTEVNNVVGNLNIIFSLARHAPDAHLLKMGSMGEYGTPNITITEGDIEIEYKGRRDRFLFPRMGQSFYHLSKIFDTYNLLLANDIYGLRVTDIMQGVVFGTRTHETVIAEELQTRLDFDSTWGTVINKYVVQAVLLKKLLIYGKGRQTRGFLSLYDSINAMTLLLENPPREGEYRTVNQLDMIYDTLTLAQMVAEVAKEYGIDVDFERIEDPRVEKEEHFYDVEHRVLPSLGFRREKDMKDVIREIFEDVIKYRSRVESMKELIYPYARWKDSYIYDRQGFSLPKEVERPLTVSEILKLAGFG